MRLREWTTRRHRRGVAVLIAVQLWAIASLSIPMPASAAPIFALPCSDAALQKNWSTVDRYFPSGAMVTGVLADMRVRNLRPCTNPSSSSWDMPFMVVTLQRDLFVNDPNNIVQIGYTRG